MFRQTTVRTMCKISQGGYAREDSISALEQDVAYLEFEIKKAKEQVKELEQMLMLRKLSK